MSPHGTDADTESLIALGAGIVVDYIHRVRCRQVRTADPDGVDALINLIGTTSAEIPRAAVRKDGRVATTTMVPTADMFAAIESLLPLSVHD